MQDQDFILFEDYLSGHLSLEEKQAFETRLESDALFNEAFEAYKETSGFLEHHIKNKVETEAFKANLERVSSAYFNKQVPSKTKRMNPWYYSMAAAAILAIGFFIAQQFSSPVYDDFANYGTISLTVRGTQNNLTTKAETAFNNHNYKDAERYFLDMLETDKDNIELQLYRAVSLVELNKYDEADKLYNNIIQTPSVYKNKAIWYLALSKLKQGDEEACVNVLKTLPEEAEDYQQAQELIKKLD